MTINKTTKVDDFLEHYGVLGMHWGVRKNKGYDNLGRKSRGGEHAKPKIRELTDAELQTRIKRIDMETKYAKITNPKSARMVKGEKAVGQFFKKYGWNLAMTAISLAAGYAAVKNPSQARSYAYSVQKVLSAGPVKVITG